MTLGPAKILRIQVQALHNIRVQGGTHIKALYRVTTVAHRPTRRLQGKSYEYSRSQPYNNIISLTEKESYH